MNKIVSSLLLIVINFGFGLQAQSLKRQRYVADLEQRKLIVLVEVPREDILKTLTFNIPHTADAYRADVAGYNALLRKIVPLALPPASPEPLFLTWEDIRLLPDKNHYLLFRIWGYNDDEISPHLIWRADLDGLQANQRFESLLHQFSVHRLEKAKRQRPKAGQVYLSGMSNILPEEADIYAFFGLYQWYLQDYALGGSSFFGRYTPSPKTLGLSLGTLTHKTLLIDRRHLAPEMDEYKLREAYPFPVQAVESSVIALAIAQADPKYAFAHRLVEYKPSNTSQENSDFGRTGAQVNYRFLIFDSKSLLPLAVSRNPQRFINTKSLKGLF